MTAKRHHPSAAAPAAVSAPARALPGLRVPRDWLPYVVVILVSLLGAAWALQLWRADLSMPLHYGGDAAMSASVVKGMSETGWVWVNPSLGAPGQMNLLDYPGADTLHQALVGILVLLTRSWAVAFNLFYLLGFPLAGATSLWAMRRLGMSAPSAVAASVLYALLPYHFIRGETHYYLSAYFLVPVAAILAIELTGRRPPLVRTEGSGASLEVRSRRALFPIVACLLIGMAGIYYAVFACFFFLVAAAIGWWRSGQRARVAAGAVLVGCVLLTTLASITPSLWYWRTAGPNPGAVVRSSGEAEMYPLRITQMVLPLAGHRSAFLDLLRTTYNKGLGDVTGIDPFNEGYTAALGIVGTIGFLFLLLVALFGRRSDGDDSSGGVAGDVSRLVLCGLLLATSSGFGAILAIGFKQIRAYNRISVYIAFFALLGAGALLDRLAHRMSQEGRPYVALLAAVAVIAVGAWDQTTPAMVPDYAGVQARWAATGDLVRRIESELPARAMILQLPYVPFPENPPVVSMSDYDHLKPYLQSTHLRWSYGAVKGRETAAMLEAMSKKPAKDLIEEARSKGFAGLWIDRAGYKDGGAAILGELERAGLSGALLSADERYVFVPL